MKSVDENDVEPVEAAGAVQEEQKWLPTAENVNAQPSPARRDKDAERVSEQVMSILTARTSLSTDALDEVTTAIMAAVAPAVQAQESAPSGETIATWDQRQRSSKYVRSAESCMLDEIAELREALARRATAGTTAAPAECGNCFEGKSDMDHICRVCNGSGRATAGNAAPVYFFRQKGTNQWIESEADPRESFADRTVGLCMEYRTLYMNPVTSNAGAAPRGISINIDKERARFEAAHPNFALCRSADGPYCAWVEDRWQGWLAAKSEAIP